MRSITQMKRRLLQEIAHAVRRPGMHAFGESATEQFFLGHLADVLFIDEREGQLEIALKTGGLFRSCGAGPVLAEAIYGRSDRIVPSVLYEMASLYAEVAYGLGYLKMDRTLKPAEWKAMKMRLCRGGHLRDWSTDEVKAEFGPPSLETGWVLPYVCDDPAQPWLHLDHGVGLGGRQLADRQRMARAAYAIWPARSRMGGFAGCP